MGDRYSGGNSRKLVDRLNVLENRHVKATYFERSRYRSGGRITPPEGATIILDSWDEGVDCLVTGVDKKGFPNYKEVKGNRDIITSTLTENGYWQLSEASVEDLAIIYVCSTPLRAKNEALDVAELGRYMTQEDLDKLKKELIEEIKK